MHYVSDFTGSMDHPLEEIRKRTQSRRTATGERVSVVICTHERPGALARCLRSLQELEEKPHEILVVDNAPQTPSTRELVERNSGIRYVCEQKLGLSRARNAGIRNTNGDIVAFTDDDVIVDPRWISALLHAFADEAKVMAVTGLVLPAELNSCAQAVFEQRFGFHRGYLPHRFSGPQQEVWNLGAGANMAIRRRAFEIAGAFDERLGAGAAGCSEDTELWSRLLEHGFECQYTPLAVVHHFHRADFDGLRCQLHDYMRGHVAAQFIGFQRTRQLDGLRRIAAVLPAFYLKQCPRLLISRSRIDAGLWWSAVSGYLSGLRYLLGPAATPRHLY